MGYSRTMAPVKKNALMMYVESRQTELTAAGHSEEIGQLSELFAKDWEKLSGKAKQKFYKAANEYNDLVRKGKITAPSSKTKEKTVAVKNPESTAGPSRNATVEKMGKKQKQKTTENRYGSIEQNRQIVRGIFENGDFDWKDQPIVVCTFTLHAQPQPGVDDLGYYPAEVALTAMTVEQGVTDNFARLIDPGSIPKEYRAQVTKAMTKTHVPKVGSAPEVQNYAGLVTTIKNFLQKHKGLLGGKEVYVFCIDSKFVQVAGCFDWLFKNADHSFPMKILSLTSYGIWAVAEPQPATGFKPLDSESEDDDEDIEERTKKDSADKVVYRYGVLSNAEEVEKCVNDCKVYKNYRQLCCVYHFKIGKGLAYCALNISNRTAHSLLEVIVYCNKMFTVVGAHVPVVNDKYAEWRRRTGMLRAWGVTIMEENLEEEADESGDEFRTGYDWTWLGDLDEGMRDFYEV